MSLKEQVIRHHLIIKKVRQGKYTQKEIQQYLESEGELNEYNFTCDRKTFKRVLDDIALIYGIDIICDKSDNKYYIEFDGLEEGQKRIIEALDTFQAFNMRERLIDYIHFDSRKALGTHLIYPLFTAIKNRKKITFNYQAFYHETSVEKIVCPYALKESQGRWYLVALDLYDNTIKTFGLDRLSNPQEQNETFDYPNDFNVHKHFENSFGIIRNGNNKPEKVLLEFTADQAKYIKTYKLHKSQTLIEETKDKVIFELNVHITFDFIKELCSYGNQLIVLQPASLEKEIRKIHRSAYSNYQIKTLEEALTELNEMLTDTVFSRKHLDNILEVLKTHYNIEFKILDLSRATHEFKEQLRDEKIAMVLQQNFEYAAMQRDREKKVEKYLKLKEELGITKSKFYLDGNKIFYCFSNTMINDKTVLEIIEDYIKTNSTNKKGEI